MIYQTDPVSEEAAASDDQLVEADVDTEVVEGEMTPPICPPVGKPTFLRRLGMWLQR